MSTACPIQTGALFPTDINVVRVTCQEISPFNTSSFQKGKFIIFGVPGAFTPTCSHQHVPSFLDLAHRFEEEGIAGIYCVSVNDPFVMQAWAKDFESNNDDKITFLSDGSGELTATLGMNLDLRQLCLGIRSQRYVLVIQDGVVEHMCIEDDASECSISRANSVLEAIS